ncbi:MAG: hypothetical protein M3Y82_00635, partial [Verrucomicrobiota bacterium]|nr:hypothetical protein [Verrucomicrobiota bacterium]
PATAEGKITIDYTPIVNTPKSSGIEAIFVSAPTTTPPVLAAIPNKIINSGDTLTFTNSASDSDIPPQTLTFSLDSGAPLAATIHPTSGIFTWTAPTTFLPTTNAVTVRVSDNGSPALSATRTFSIVVVAPPSSSSLTVSNGAAQITWSVYPDKIYRLQYKDDLNEPIWTNVPGDITATDSTLSITQNIGQTPQRFFRLVQLN